MIVVNQLEQSICGKVLSLEDEQDFGNDAVHLEGIGHEENIVVPQQYLCINTLALILCCQNDTGVQSSSFHPFDERELPYRGAEGAETRGESPRLSKKSWQGKPKLDPGRVPPSRICL